MNVIHLISSIGFSSYGLGQVAVNLVKAQLALGCNAVIWTLDSVDERQKILNSTGLPPEAVQCFKTIGPKNLCFSIDMLRAAKKKGHGIDIVHQHGIWTGISLVANAFRYHSRTPTVIAPHGSLEASVLKKSYFKKKLATLGYESTNLHGASCLHATSQQEIDDFRSFGLPNNIALIQNGISRDWLESTGDGNRFRVKFHVPLDKSVALFMSRIAPKKGLPMLLQAWATMSAAFPQWVLVIIGGDEDGHLAEVKALVSKLDMAAQVVFVEPVLGQDKRDAFAAANLFVLPSTSEGFPMVVLDALGAKVPAIVTRASSWEALQNQHCGWWVDTSVEGLAGALGEALGLPSGTLESMGLAGYELVSKDYTWPSFAHQTLTLYNWLRSEGERPSFVSSGLSGKTKIW